MLTLAACTTTENPPLATETTAIPVAMTTTSFNTSETCTPAQLTGNAGEAQLVTTDSFEAWSLWFTRSPLPSNSPIKLANGEEVKVVWSVTGDGEFSVIAAKADGTLMELDWGPDAHGGSNWGVPGDEWGTGWTFPEAGCWTFTVTRGSEVARLTVEVAP
jgi:hypothetical protein